MRGVRGREATQRAAGGRVAPGGTVVDAPTPGNLLLTPSFEVDSNADGLADSWLPYGSGTYFHLVAAVQSGHGSNAQRIDPDGTNTAAINQRVAVAAGHSYTLTTVYLIRNLNGGQFVRKVEWYAANGTTLVDYTYQVDSVSTTGQSTSDLLTAPAGAFFANVVLSIENGGQVDIDSVSLTTPAPFFTDPFTRADGDLGSPWYYDISNAHSQISGNKVVSPSGTSAAALALGMDNFLLDFDWTPGAIIGVIFCAPAEGGVQGAGESWYQINIGYGGNSSTYHWNGSTYVLIDSVGDGTFTVTVGSPARVTLRAKDGALAVTIGSHTWNTTYTPIPGQQTIEIVNVDTTGSVDNVSVTAT